MDDYVRLMFFLTDPISRVKLFSGVHPADDAVQHVWLDNNAVN